MYLETRYKTPLRILTRATGFPGAQGDMLQLTVIPTLVIYSLDYLENVWFVGLFQSLQLCTKTNHLSSLFKIGGLRVCFPQIRPCSYYKYTGHLVEHVTDQSMLGLIQIYHDL